MSRYEFLKKNEDIMFQFIKRGIISYHILRDIEIYESFRALANISREAKYLLIADEYELSNKRIEQIIYAMDKK